MSVRVLFSFGSCILFFLNELTCSCVVGAASLTKKLDAPVRKSEIDHRYDCRSRLFPRLFLYCFDRVTKRVAKKRCGLFAAIQRSCFFWTIRSLIGIESHQRRCFFPSFDAGVSFRLKWGRNVEAWCRRVLGKSMIVKVSFPAASQVASEWGCAGTEIGVEDLWAGGLLRLSTRRRIGCEIDNRMVWTGLNQRVICR